jgi:hypothetical protein
MSLKATKQFCDLVIQPRWLIPVVPENVVLEQHAIVISKDKIVDIGFDSGSGQCAYARRDDLDARACR